MIAKNVLQSAAAQVRRCYRSPRTSSSGRQIVTRLAVRLDADGSLVGLPIILSQSGLTPQNESEARRMAEAASLAVIRCSPLKLPPEHHSLIWRSFELTFSRSVRV